MSLDPMRVARRSLLALILAMLQGCASTILTAPCEAPRVSNFGVPDVYLVVMPYAYRDQPRSLVEPPDPGTAATRRLNELASLEAVRMAADATDLHVTLLEDSGRGCRIGDVYAALGNPHRRSGRNVVATTVFFWGEVFDDEKGLVVQSHLRVLWKDDDRIRVRADAGQGGDRADFEFVADVPYETLSFAPRRLPAITGDGGPPDLRTTMAAWAVPSVQHPEDRRPLPTRFMFRQVKRTKTEGAWVEVQDLRGEGATVWLPLNDASAATLLPEFSFANALAGFIGYQKAMDPDVANGVGRRLDEFRRGYDQVGRTAWNARPDAAADVLQGALELVRGGDLGARGGTAAATRTLDRALAALPDDPVVLTLSAMARVEACCTTREAAQRVGAMFESAQRADPANRRVATNLVTWYRMAMRLPPAVRPEEVEALARKLADLEDALK